MSTLSTSLPRVDTARWLAIVSALSRQFPADLLLSDNSRPGEGKSYIALDPTHELIVDSATNRQDLERFTFSDGRPTIGFLSYEYGAERLGIESAKQSQFPLGHLKKYRAIVTHDVHSGEIAVDSDDGQLIADISGKICRSTAIPKQKVASRMSRDKLGMSLNRDEYLNRVHRTLEYIRAGDIYQLSLSLKYSVKLDEPVDQSTVIDLFALRPASYYAYFNSGPYRILSTSPECFLRVREGQVQSRPIKGTLRFDKYDPHLVRQLQTSPKEDAELSMIVDLIRNDISRNCEYGSVTVSDHKSVFAVDNLLQMYSTVAGRLRDDRTCLDLLLDAFPGGSVTGCPKKRAVELIDELEPHCRDIYCGSFFIIKDQQTMDSSIAIRTGYYDDRTVQFSFFAGSGIVVESDPEAEYEETVAKAEKFLTLL